MTDNITKLYELAEVEGNWERYTEEDLEGCINIGLRRVLPTFTAEKQLELIKWLATKQEKFSISYDSDYGYTCEVVNSNNCYESFCYYEPAQALCNLIIGLWNDLTDEQKAEVKRILE